MEVKKFNHILMSSRMDLLILVRLLPFSNFHVTFPDINGGQLPSLKTSLKKKNKIEDKHTAVFIDLYNVYNE